MGEQSTPPASILLVEDNPDHALLAKLALSRLDEVREVRVALDGVDALEILRGGAAPDLVLLDLRLPRLDGFALLAEMNRDPRLSRVPVVVLTTSAAGADLERSRALGARGYLNKPLDPQELRTLLVRMASEGGGDQQDLPI